MVQRASWELWASEIVKFGLLSQLVPLDKEVGLERARLGPAARLGPQLSGVRLKPRKAHGGIIGEILAKGRKSP